MRQRTATTRDAVSSQESVHEAGTADVLNVLQPRQEDPSTSVNTADEESKTDTQTMDRQEPRSRLSMRQSCEGEDVKDIPFDVETLETHNSTTFADAPKRDTHIEDTGVGKLHWKENTGTGNLPHTAETKKLTLPQTKTNHWRHIATPALNE